MMDWYSWLSKSGSLDPSLVYEYSLLFSRNELDADDIPDFDHDFLRSMGVSIAKHRLHILRLAKKENKTKSAAAGTFFAGGRLLAAIHKTTNCLARYVRSWVRGGGDDASAIVAVPRHEPHGRRRGSAMLKRTRRAACSRADVRPTRPPPMITDGGAAGRVRNAAGGGAPPSLASRPRGASPTVCKGGGGEEIRWDCMFQGLKPT